MLLRGNDSAGAPPVGIDEELLQERRLIGQSDGVLVAQPKAIKGDQGVRHGVPAQGIVIPVGGGGAAAGRDGKIEAATR